MTSHDKPHTAHDEMVLKDLAKLEKTGVVPHGKPTHPHMDLAAIARASEAQDVGSAMLDSAGVGSTPTGALPEVETDDESTPSGRGFEQTPPTNPDADK